MKQSNAGKFLLLVGRVLKIALRNPRALRELFGQTLAVAEQLTDPSVDVTVLPSNSVESILEEGGTQPAITIWATPQVARSISLHEAICLAVLMKRSSARRVFEFGTYRGISTTQLALNLAADGRVLTLDLPVDDLNTKFELDTIGEVEVVKDARKGDLIPDHLRARIEFIQQDSALFDPTPYENSMDLVFVDGAHTPEYVKNDSEKAWRMLRPGGILCWHDCRFNSPGVVRFLRECSYEPRRILGGSIAFAVKPGLPIPPR
jgi:hypothetical protein